MSNRAHPANPLFSQNRIKLGVFALNGAVIAMTRIPNKYEPTWPNSLDVVAQADAAGYEAIVPYARWGSLGRTATHYSARVFENFTWAAGIAARTAHCCVMATAQVQTVHPLFAAKAIATVDHISNGRFALNLVVGNEMEARMFGAPVIAHAELYDYADEWISVVKRLWTETDYFDHNGKYLHLKDAVSQPKPIQTPYPALMNAARSQQGQQFVARHCDVAFVRDNERGTIKSQVDNYRRMAREDYHREIQVWCNCNVVQSESREEALRFVHYYVDEYGDEEYVDRFIELLNPGANTLPVDQRDAMRRSLKQGIAGQPLLGTAQDIAAAIDEISSYGIDGILLNWIDPGSGIRAFNDQVLPLLERAGLRAPGPNSLVEGTFSPHAAQPQSKRGSHLRSE
jgi:alkanesulfonate monooxygenase SsuD/methylene tetrahydromethanopterin reductase-like flavin-dependent oxidoreductase (luciferase family)